MKKEDRQIVWKDNIGFYNGNRLFEIWFYPPRSVYDLCFIFKGNCLGLNRYKTLKSAKRGAERFLKRLQETVK